jgi:hypothetical protein
MQFSEQKKTWNKVVVVYFKVLLQNLPRLAEERQKNLIDF